MATYDESRHSGPTGKGNAMAEVTVNRQQIETLGQKLDHLADSLDEQEKMVLSAVFELAAQQANTGADLPLSQHLERVFGSNLRLSIDAGAITVIM